MVVMDNILVVMGYGECFGVCRGVCVLTVCMCVFTVSWRRLSSKNTTV